MMAYGQTIHSPKGFAVTVPPGWQSKQDFMGAPVVIFAKPVDHFAANLNVVVVNKAPGDAVEKIPQMQKSMYPRMFTNYHFVGGHFATLGGHKSYESTATHETGTPSRKLRMQQDITIIGDKAYTVTCTAPDATFRQYASAFNAMIKSIKFTAK